MAVRAQHAEINEAVVASISIDVIKLKRNWFSIPFDILAFFALGLFQTKPQQALPQVVGVNAHAVLQHLLERLCLVFRGPAVPLGPAQSYEVCSRQIEALYMPMHDRI